jgi:hypothetical protein
MDLPSQTTEKGDLERIKDLKIRGYEKYPVLAPYHAFIWYMKYDKRNVFFLNDDGERCVWRSGKSGR